MYDMHMGLKRSQIQGEAKQTGKPGDQIANEACKRTVNIWPLSAVNSSPMGKPCKHVYTAGNTEPPSHRCLGGRRFQVFPSRVAARKREAAHAALPRAEFSGNRPDGTDGSYGAAKSLLARICELARFPEYALIATSIIRSRLISNASRIAASSDCISGDRRSRALSSKKNATSIELSYPQKRTRAWTGS